MSASLTHHGATAVVTLDWPERRNVLGPVEAGQVADALSTAAGMDDVSAVVLTGNGAFCAGGDLSALAELAAKGPEVVREAIYGNFHRLIRTIIDMPVPILAAVDGPAVGVGMDLALACDWRIVGRDGSFRHAWGELALIPGTGGELLLRRIAPGLIWPLLGRPGWIDPAEAVRLRLAEAAEDDALGATLALADGLAHASDAALHGYARLHRAALRNQLDAHLDVCLELQVTLLCSPEFRTRAERALDRLSRR